MSVHAEEDALKYARIILETVEANDGQAPVSNRTARLLASALIPLAAESEELRAKLEKTQNEERAIIAALHNAESERDDLRAENKDWQRRWDLLMRQPTDVPVKGMGVSPTFSIGEMLERLESRYTALEKAARALDDVHNAEAEGDPAGYRDDWISALGALNAALAALTPKEGE
jgi:FtsZ-binding cell division protein ZapB